MIYQVNPTAYGMILNIIYIICINKYPRLYLNMIYPKQQNRCFCSRLNNNPRLLTLFERFGWKVQPRTWVHGWMKDSVWQCFFWEKLHAYLVGGWTNPSEKYETKWECSPNRGENQKWLNQQPPPRYSPCLNSSFLNCKVLMMSFSMAIGNWSYFILFLWISALFKNKDTYGPKIDTTKGSIVQKVRIWSSELYCITSAETLHLEPKMLEHVT